MKKKQNRHSLHLIRQNVPQFILLVIFSVLLGVSVIAVSVLMKMFLDIATNASTMPLTTCLIIAVGVLLVLGISQVVTSVLQGKLSCRMELSLRSAMVEHLYRTDLRTFDSSAADNYFTRMTKDAETLSNFYSKTLIPSIFFESFTRGQDSRGRPHHSGGIRRRSFCRRHDHPLVKTRHTVKNKEKSKRFQQAKAGKGKTL